MAIGGSELLLIVRAQNQASAAIGRVSRDLRGLERQRNLNARLASAQNRAAAQALQIAKSANADGTKALQLRQAVLRTENQIASVSERAASFAQRRAAIRAREASLMRQERAIQDRIAGIEGKRLSLTEKQIAAQQRLSRTQTSIAGLASGKYVDGQLVGVGIDRQAAALAAHRATTTRMLAEQRVAAISQAEIVDPRRLEIASRRLTEAQGSESIAKQRVGQLDVALRDLQKTEERQGIELRRLKLDAQSLEGEEARLTQLLEDQKLVWAQLQARSDAVTAAEHAQVRQLDELEQQLAIARSATLENAEAVKIQTAAYEEQIKVVKELQAAQARQSLETRRTQFQALSHGGRIAQMGGMVTTAGLGFAAVGAARFQQQATLAATQAGNSYSSVLAHSNSIQRQTLRLMQQFPASAEDVTKSFYDIYSSMDVSDKQASRLMRTFERLSVAGMAPLQDVTNAGITIMNNFADAMKNPERATNMILSTVRYGRINLQQYTQTLNQLVPAFKGAGQTFLQMNAALAETTRLMPSQRMGATGLARLTEIFSNPKFVDGVKQFGISMQDAQGRMRPFSNIITQFGRSTNPTIKALRDGRLSAAAFFKEVSGQQGTIQGRRVFQVLIRDSKGLTDRLHQLNRDSNELNKSFAAMMQTPGTRWDITLNRLKVMGILIGNAVIPAFEKMGAFVLKAVDWFNHLSPATQKWIGVALAFISVGTLVAGVLATIVGGLGSMFVAWRLMRVERMVADVSAVAGGFGKLGIAEAGAIDPLVAIGLAATALTIKLGGLHAALHLVGTILGALALRQAVALLARFGGALIGLAGKFAIFGGEATAAAGGVTLLEASLMRLMALGPYVVPVLIIEYHKQIRGFVDKIGKKFSDLIPGGHSTAIDRIPGLSAVQDFAAPLTNILTMGDYNRYNKDPNENKKHVNIVPPQAAIKASQQRVHAFWDKVFKQSAAIAKVEGVKNTPTFQKLYENLLIASQNVKAHPASLQAQMRLIDAQNALKANVTQQQYQASVKAINATHNGIKASDAEIMAMARRVAALKKIATAHKTNLADWKRYEDALAKLQGMGTAAQQAATQDVLSAMEDATKKTATKARHAVDQVTREARSDLKKMAETIQQASQEFQSQNESAFGTIFQGPVMTGARMQRNIQWGGKATGGDLLNDLKAQISRFRQFRRAVGTLQKRGAPFPLIQQLLAAGPDALPELRALEQLDKADFRTYVKEFDVGQSLVAKATTMDVGRQLKYWHSFGRQAMRAFMEGMDKETATHPNRWGTMIAAMFPTLTQQATHGHADNPAYVQYIYNGGTMDYSTWLRKSKRHHKNRGK